MSRRLAALASIGLCGAVLAPLVRAPDDDGFPLSTYPMFAAPRPAALTMAWARGRAADGGPRSLSPGHLGTGEVMQAFATMQRAAGAGPDERAALCAEIAARVAGDAGLGDVVEIELVGGTYDAVAGIGRIAGGAAVEREAVLARCAVARKQR